MPVAVRQTEDQKEVNPSQRLKDLQDKAAAIRTAHRAGKIDAREAARQLTELKRRYSSIVDALVGA